MEGILAIVLIFGGGSIFLFAISPIGRAIADRIRGTGDVGRGTQSADGVTAEVQALRRELAELAERMDFLERLQAKPRDAERLAPPR